MKLVVSVIIVITLELLGCCKSDNDQEPCFLEDVQSPINIDCYLTKDLDTTRLFIQGLWTLLQEERRQRGKPIEFLTPKNQGYSSTLELKGETAKFYRCGQLEDSFKFSVVRLKEISGTDFPEDEDPVLVLYNLETGLRISHVPLKICNSYLVLQYQYVSSIVGEKTWKRIPN